MKSIFVIFILAALVSMSSGYKMFAFAVLSDNGTFSCNPSDMNLEKASYKHVVSFLNSGIIIDKKLDPNISEQQLHDNLVGAMGASGYKSVDLYNKERLCLSSNGIDPDSVATLSDETIKALNYGTTIPEFRSIVGFVTVVAIISVIITTRKL